MIKYTVLLNSLCCNVSKIIEQVNVFYNELKSAKNNIQLIISSHKIPQVEALWPIFKIHHQKSRYLYDLYYKRKAISKELYDYCLKEKIADANLIAKWKKDGYERLCCLRCIQVSIAGIYYLNDRLKCVCKRCTYSLLILNDIIIN